MAKKSLNSAVVHQRCGLVEARRKLGVSQPEMAKRLGLSVSGLWKIEQGTEVKLTVARKIAKHYKKSLCELWPEEPEAKKKR